MTAAAHPKSVVRSRNQRGFTLALVAICLTVMVAMMGMAFDVGRMFILKNELQTFVDASALAAVHSLDGTQLGVQNANNTATQGPLGTTKPNGYNFDTTVISNVTATFSTSSTGTYDSFAAASTPATNHYSFVNVTASASVPMSFLPVLPGISTSYTLSATAVAGQQQSSSIGYGGGFPFLPDAHNTSDTTNWGFTPGGEYTLKWGTANGNGNGNGKGKGGGNGNGNSNATTNCANDLNWNDPNPASQHGFIDLGQGNADSALTNLIVYGGYPNPNSTPSSLYVGLMIGGVPGDKGTQVFTHVQDRVDQDTDTTSTTYSDYMQNGRGNGRRVVTVPIGDPGTWNGNGNGSEQIIGFANFFLETSYNGNSGSLCAIYIGPGNLNGNASATTDATKIYFNMLFK